MAFRLLRKRRRQAVAEQELLFGPEDEAEARLLSSRCFFHMNEVVSEVTTMKLKLGRKEVIQLQPKLSKQLGQQCTRLDRMERKLRGLLRQR